MNELSRRLGRRRRAPRLDHNTPPPAATWWRGMLACVVVLAALGMPARAARIDHLLLDDVPIIGVTPSKSTGLNLSRRSRGETAGEAAQAVFAAGVAEGDQYDATGLYIDVDFNSFDLDVDSGLLTFGLPFDENAGDNFFSLVSMRIKGTDHGANYVDERQGIDFEQQGTNFITVSYFTADMSPLLPIGAVFSEIGTIITGWGLEVGAVNPIQFGPLVTFEIHDSGIQFIDNTRPDPEQRILADFPIIDTSTPPSGGLSGRQSANVVGRAAGFPVDEMVMYWDITIIPEPTSIVLIVIGTACLAGRRPTRRRRNTNSPIL